MYSLFICALKTHCSIHHLLWVVVIRILSLFCNVTSSNFTVWSTNTFKFSRTYTHYQRNTIKPHNQPSSVKCSKMYDFHWTNSENLYNYIYSFECLDFLSNSSHTVRDSKLCLLHLQRGQQKQCQKHFEN